MRPSKLKTLIVILISITSLISCGATLKEYQDTTPEFNLETFFTGDLKGWGLVKNRQGKVTQRFSVDMNGTWNNNQGTLYELFKYSDGRTQERIWKLINNEDGTSTGTAGDVVGTATGKHEGFAFNWSYQLLVDTNDGQLKVTLHDWLYQIDQHAVVSEAQIKKFGINVGEVLVFIVKQDA